MSTDLSTFLSEWGGQVKTLIEGSSSISKPVEPILQIFCDGTNCTVNKDNLFAIYSKTFQARAVTSSNTYYSLALIYDGDGELTVHAGTTAVPDKYSNNLSIVTNTDYGENWYYIVGDISGYAFNDNIKIYVTSSATKNYLAANSGNINLLAMA